MRFYPLLIAGDCHVWYFYPINIEYFDPFSFGGEITLPNFENISSFGSAYFIIPFLSLCLPQNNTVTLTWCPFETNFCAWFNRIRRS
jgi:hypothetical protein